MSIYATTVGFNADDHGPDCARWVECPPGCNQGHNALFVHAVGGHARYDDTQDCSCGCGPIAYRASHILPSDTDPRGGCFSLAEIPGHITRDGRQERDEDSPWPWLRASLNAGDVVLDRAQVVEVHAYLGDWLKRTEET